MKPNIHIKDPRSVSVELRLRPEILIDESTQDYVVGFYLHIGVDKLEDKNVMAFMSTDGSNMLTQDRDAIWHFETENEAALAILAYEESQ